jgi:hypothetical protein
MKVPIGIRRATSEPLKTLRLQSPVFRMRINPLRIGLPDFDQAIWYRNAFCIDQLPLDQHVLAGCIRAD